MVRIMSGRSVTGFPSFSCLTTYFLALISASSALTRSEVSTFESVFNRFSSAVILSRTNSVTFCVAVRNSCNENIELKFSYFVFFHPSCEQLIYLPDLQNSIPVSMIRRMMSLRSLLPPLRTYSPLQYPFWSPDEGK